MPANMLITHSTHYPANIRITDYTHIPAIMLITHSTHFPGHIAYVFRQVCLLRAVHVFRQ